MNIIEACRRLFKNKKLYAKRIKWENEMICIREIGWASQHEKTELTEEGKNDPSKFYIEHINNNRLCGQMIPSLEDIITNDWIIIDNNKL